MKNNILLFATIILFCACEEQTRRPPTPNNQKQTTKKRDTFPNDFAKNNYWLMADVVLNGKYTVRFVFDNNSSGGDTLVLDKDFLESGKMIRDKTPISLNKFQRTALNYSFGSFRGTEFWPATAIVPKSSQKVNGIIGADFLKNQIVEVDFKHNIFFIDSALVLNTAKYQSIKLVGRGNGHYLDLPITFYAKDRKIIRYCHFDLGCSGDGFVLGTWALSKIFPEIKPSKQAGSKGEVITTSLEKTQTVAFRFDSVNPDTQVLLKNCSAYLLFANSGIAGSDMALFGLGVFEHYSKIYIDFKNNRLHLPLNDE